MTRRVRQEIVEHLDDAPRVRQHARQVFRQVDGHGAPASGPVEGTPGLIDEAGNLDPLDGDRESARRDAPLVQQVGNQIAHPVCLIVDDPEELQHLGRIRGRRGAQHGGRRSLDRDQGRSEFVAHHAQKLGPQPVQLLEGRQVLQGDHHRLDRAPPWSESAWR